MEDPKDDKQISKALGKRCRPLYTLQGLLSGSNRDLESKVFCSGYSSDKACSGDTKEAPRVSRDAVLMFFVSQMANWIRRVAGVGKVLVYGTKVAPQVKGPHGGNHYDSYHSFADLHTHDIVTVHMCTMKRCVFKK